MEDKYNNKRKRAHDEIRQIAEENADISRIDTYSRTEAESNSGMSWPYLADIFFANDESLSSVHQLRDVLDENEYLVRVEEKDSQTCLSVRVTYELYEERFE